LALFGRESAEAAQLHAFATGEGVYDLAENRVDDVLDVALIEMRIAGGHALHELRLDHRTSPRNDPGVSPSQNALKARHWISGYRPAPQALAPDTRSVGSTTTAPIPALTMRPIMPFPK
jgi:hypothetical protein